HAARNLDWKLPMADQSRDADRRIHRAPALGQQIDGDENILREKRRRHEIHLSRMAAALQVSRQVNLEALALQMKCRRVFRARTSLDHMPGNRRNAHIASSSSTGPTRSRSGSKTRSLPKCATARSKLGFVVTMSVMTTASICASTPSNELTTGTLTKRAPLAEGSTTSTTSRPDSRPQMMHISARSDFPTSASRLKPHRRASSNNAPQSFLATRKKPIEWVR